MVTVVAAVLALAGCAGLDDPAAERQRHLQAFTGELGRRAADLKGEVSLEQCQALAMDWNTDVRQAALRERLAELDRRLAVSAFLPQVSAGASLHTWSVTPAMTGIQTSEKSVRSGTLEAVAPIFAPSLWLLYANRRLGLEQQKLAAHLVRQSIVYQVTVLYYRCLLQEETLAALESQLQAARSQDERITALQGEGLARAWEADQARLLRVSRENEQLSSRRTLQAARSELLAVLGVSPLHPLRLSRPAPLAPLPAATTAELVFMALASHPELALADRQIVIRENEVRQAIAAFLPRVSGIVSGSLSSDGLTVPQDLLSAGASATLDLFQGFAHLNRYRGARLVRNSAELARDGLTLRICLEVVAQEAALRNADSQLQVLEQACLTARHKFADYDQRQREGVVPVHEMLEARAALDLAETALIAGRYTRLLQQAALAMAMGTLPVPAAHSAEPAEPAIPLRAAPAVPPGIFRERPSF